ncbi:MAG: hypothetical protein PWQ19_1839, partial [Tepidiphilus sp.]|nr:hypothetical protein [Tepidiphilus sp.]
AIDRATRWVFVAIYPEKTAANARRFLSSLIEAAPFRLHTILTDNGKEFTDCFITRGERTPTGAHAFDELCQALEIEHRLTKPRHPQTNGMVERFNGRISEVLATHRFDSREALEATIQRYVWLYNHHIPQKALGHVTPIEAMKKWYSEKPEIFIKKPRNRPGPDTTHRHFLWPVGRRGTRRRHAHEASRQPRPGWALALGVDPRLSGATVAALFRFGRRPAHPRVAWRIPRFSDYDGAGRALCLAFVFILVAARFHPHMGISGAQ